MGVLVNDDSREYSAFTTWEDEARWLGCEKIVRKRFILVRDKETNHCRRGVGAGEVETDGRRVVALFKAPCETLDGDGGPTSGGQRARTEG
eukprot:6188092-Pleurochrysis_carterae.AAC.3